MSSLLLNEKNLVYNTLLLLKLDAQILIKRIFERKADYIHEFSLKRQRNHFAEIFLSRYYDLSIHDLKFCDSTILMSLNQFYTLIDELKWYLNHTQDMTNMVEDYVDQYLRKIKSAYEQLSLYLDAQLSLEDIQN